MKVLWEVFEIAVNFFQGFIMVYFLYDLLGDKRNRKFLKSPAVFCGILLAIFISIMNYLTIFEHIYAVIYFLIIFTFTLICSNGSILSKFFASVFPILIMAMSTAFMGNFSAMLLKTNLYDLLSKNDMNRFVAIVSTQMCILYFTILFLKILKSNGKGDHELAVREWIMISLVLIISVVIAAFLNLISLKSTSRESDIYIISALVGIILINIVVCYLVNDLRKMNDTVRENELLKIKQEYNSQYIENANREYDAIRKLRHDFKDNYRVVHTLLCDGKIDRAMEHIEKIQSSSSGMEVFIRTDNDIANAIINAKLNTAKSLGIEPTCLSVKNFDGIDDLDLCRLLSNMLENAINACVNSKKSERNIYLKITSDDYSYAFSLKNTIDESVLKNNPKMKTTKKNSSEHGYGIRIIREIVRKYDGKCDFYEEDEMFCCNVVLMK